MRNLVYLSALVATCLYGAEAKDIQIIEDSIKIRITISTDALQYNDFVLHNPERIAIDFRKTSCLLPSKKPVNIPPVISIRTSQYVRTPSPVTRAVIDLVTQGSYSVTKLADGIRIDIPKIVSESRPSLMGVDEQTPEPSEVKENITTPEEKVETPKVVEKAGVPKAKETVLKEEKVEKPSEDTLVSLPVTPQDSIVVYDSRGKRDPFKPWLGGEGIESDSLLNVYNATIVGIMWSPREKYALAEDSLGKGYILSEGDKVANGRVEIINKDEVSFALYGFGGVRRITLKLLTKEERGKEDVKRKMERKLR